MKCFKSINLFTINLYINNFIVLKSFVMAEVQSNNVDNWLDSLPDEVLLEIFNYFNATSLKNLSFVCKK